MIKFPSLAPIFRLAATVALLAFKPALAADAPPPAGIPPTGPITTGLRVFTAGHSFHATFLPRLLSEIAASAGIQGHTIAGVSILGGSRAIQHFNAPPDPTHMAKAAVTAGNIDVLTLSCMSGPDEGIADFAKLGFEHNPDFRIALQEIWLPQDRFPFDYKAKFNTSPDDFNKTTMDDLKKANDAYRKAMEDYVVALNQSLGKQVVFMVPEGTAEIALREKIIAGTAPSLEKQSDLFGDWWGHPKAPLSLLSAYCQYAVIYRRSPVGLPIPPHGGIKDPALNLLLQQLAWDAVTHNPLSGVTGLEVWR
jgi:hypothetical protein